MDPVQLGQVAQDKQARREGRKPLNRQEQQQQENDRREAAKNQEEKRKNFMQLSPMLRLLVQELYTSPFLYENFNPDAINENLKDNDVFNKAQEQIDKALGDKEKQNVFMNLGKAAFGRFNQLMRWYNNSTKALSSSKESDFLNTITGLPRTVGDFIDKYPAQSGLSLRTILSTQQQLSIQEAASIRNGWIQLATANTQLFGNMSPENIISNIIQSATAPAKAFNAGGLVYASNGILIPYKPKGTDTVPAMLTPGEFVVNREATQNNLPLLRAINSGSYENGGVVKYLSDGTSGGISFAKILSSFSSNITSVTTALSGLLTTLQNGSEGVNNGSNASVGGLDGLSQFTAKFDQFITQLSKLNLPPEININGNHKVEVVINGAEALRDVLEGPLAGLVRGEIASAFGRLRGETEGALPDPSSLA
jgi:hypothetical protein